MSFGMLAGTENDCYLFGFVLGGHIERHLTKQHSAAFGTFEKLRALIAT